MWAVAEYIAALNLDEEAPGFDGIATAGDPANGEYIHQGYCKTCHGKQAQGETRRGAPFLAG